RTRHRRRAQPVDRPGGDRTRARSHSSRQPVHPTERAGGFQPALRRIVLLGRTRATRRAEHRDSCGGVGTAADAERCRVPRPIIANPQQFWHMLRRRLGAIPEYQQLFEAAYPGTRFETMTFAHASNAIAGFLTSEFVFNDSPWDRFLAGDDAALTEIELRGAKNFMSARCSVCHNGPALTDNRFHNVVVAQIGPGTGDGPYRTDDFGRMKVTRQPADRYAFRTPALRNVELTAPYGHDGAII